MKHGSMAALALFLGFGAAVLIPACTGNTGATGPAGAPGASAVPTPYCTNPSSQGLTSAGAVTNLPSVGGYIYADPITLTATTGVSLSVNVSNYAPVTGQVRMAVYGAGVTSPTILVGESNPQPTVVGWNNLSLPNLYLPAGTYYMVYMFSDNTYESFNNTGNTEYSVNYGWGRFPTSMPQTGGSITSQDAMYLSTCP